MTVAANIEYALRVRRMPKPQRREKAGRALDMVRLTGLWIFGAIRLGQRLPEVNAVVSVIIILTIIPVGLAAKVAGTGSLTRTARAAPMEKAGG